MKGRRQEGEKAMGFEVVLVLTCFWVCNPILVHANTNQNDGEFVFFFMLLFSNLLCTFLSWKVTQDCGIIKLFYKKERKLVIWKFDFLGISVSLLVSL